MKRQSFYDMGVEVLRIDNGKYYIESDDRMCLQEVDKLTFKKELEKYAKWVKDCWAEDVKERYNNILKELESE